MAENSETTDLTLFVRTTGEENILWDRQRIVNALIREADIDDQVAEKISKELLQKYGEPHSLRITRGVEQVANLWRAEDGSAGDFAAYAHAKQAKREIEAPNAFQE